MNMVTSTPSTSHERSTTSTPITTLHMTTTTKAHPEYTPTEEISTTVTTTATVTVTTHPESPERQKPGVGEILSYTFVFKSPFNKCIYLSFKYARCCMYSSLNLQLL